MNLPLADGPVAALALFLLRTPFPSLWYAGNVLSNSASDDVSATAPIVVLAAAVGVAAVVSTLSLDLLRLRSSFAADCSRVDSRLSTLVIVPDLSFSPLLSPLQQRNRSGMKEGRRVTHSLATKSKQRLAPS